MNSSPFRLFLFAATFALGGSLLFGQVQNNKLQSTGTVGVGTTSPSESLTVAGGNINLANYAYEAFDIGNTNGYIWGNHDYSGALGFFRDDLVISSNWEGVKGNTDNFFSNGTFLGNDAISLGRDGIRFFTASNTTGANLPAQRLVIDNVGNIGVNNPAPTHSLDVSGDGYFSKDTAYQLTAQNSSGSVARTSGFNLRIDNVDLWQAITDNAVANRFFLQYNGSASNRFFTIDTSGNVGIGTTTPTQKLSVNGTVRAKEVIVDTGWSDYVFADDYALPLLSDVETQVKLTKHLPGIPSAEDVARHGISLGDMQAKLLAKIEEITLHQIAQEKEIAQLKAENARLNSRLKAVEKP